jgi:pyruvate/2-oxoglutarate dehydrogenase complex dihydrolipoamide acyltransferase (E2) component
MSLTPYDPANEPGADGADAPAETPTRTPPRGVAPLSAANRRRLLAALNRAAQAGDVGAQAALVELSMSSERDARIAAALKLWAAAASQSGRGMRQYRPDPRRRRRHGPGEGFADGAAGHGGPGRRHD